MTVLEVAANVVATVSILLAARNSVHTWWIGIIGCVLFAVLFFRAAAGRRGPAVWSGVRPARSAS